MVIMKRIMGLIILAFVTGCTTTPQHSRFQKPPKLIAKSTSPNNIPATPVMLNDGLPKYGISGQLRGLPYKPNDFIENPWIPPHDDISRYEGRWADENAVQIAIKKENGKYKIYNDSSENWNYLYNNIHWENDELHFSSFAYSDKPELFTHHYHRTKGEMILTPAKEKNKIKWTLFIDNERFDNILTKK